MQKTNYTEQDIIDLERLVDGIIVIKKKALEMGTDPKYHVQIKQEAIRLKYAFGFRATTMDDALGVTHGSTDTWTVRYKTARDAGGSLYGDTVRYDLPTKGLVVKQLIEDGIAGHVLAEEYNVSNATIAGWKSKHRHDYELMINSPEGMMIRAKEEKMVIGLKNIKTTMEIGAQAKRIRNEIANTLGSGTPDIEHVNRCVDTLEELATSFRD